MAESVTSRNLIQETNKLLIESVTKEINRLSEAKRQTAESLEQTKEQIAAAMFSLMDEKQYDDISVTDIIRRSGVSRATFYRHYKTKDGILRENFYRETVNTLNVYQGRLNTADDYYELLFNVFSSCKKHEDSFRILIKAHREDLYLDFLNEEIDALSRSNKLDRDRFHYYFLVGSIFNVTVQWVRSGCRESVKQITDEYFGMVSHVFAGEA